MIEFVSGKFVEKNPAYIIVDCNGVGYLVQVSVNTYSDYSTKDSGLILVHYNVSVDIRSGESKHQLFGFSTELERQIFRLLVSISGISASIAQMILSSFRPEEFQSIVLNGDSKTLTTVKGIGPKVAQKVIGELREKLSKDDALVESASEGGNSLRQEALSALTALGFDRSSSVKVINTIMKENNPNSVEDLLKQSLKRL